MNMTSHRIIPAIVLMSAAACAVAATFPVPNDVRIVTANAFSVVMTIQTGDVVDEYVLDHNMTVSDCMGVLENVHPTFQRVSTVNISVTYACDRR